MVYSIALTGNIASGKSTVASLFSELGVSVINADEISRKLSAKNTPAFYKIVDHFGQGILLENGEINRRALRNLIFSNTEERLWLEQLLHPLIRIQLHELIKQSTTPYCIVEIPLLITKESYPFLNKILLVTSQEEMQIARVMTRDNCSQEQALAILSAQPSVALRMNSADEVLHNDAGLAELKKSVDALHKRFLIESAEFSNLNK